MSLFNKKPHENPVLISDNSIEYIKEGMSYKTVIEILRTTGNLESHKYNTKQYYWRTENKKKLTLIFVDDKLSEKIVE